MSSNLQRQNGTVLKQVGNWEIKSCILQILSLMNLFIQKKGVRKVKDIIQINY
jgi:hypothetical protein